MKREVWTLFQRLVRLGFIFLLALLYPASLSADLSGSSYRIIRIAFMNGCARALGHDLDTIRSLKQDRQGMKKFIEYQTEKYMSEVRHLNRLDGSKISSKRPKDKPGSDNTGVVRFRTTENLP